MNFTSQDAETGMGVKKMCDIIFNNGNFQGGGFFYGMLIPFASSLGLRPFYCH